MDYFPTAITHFFPIFVETTFHKYNSEIFNQLILLNYICNVQCIPLENSFAQILKSRSLRTLPIFGRKSTKFLPFRNISTSTLVETKVISLCHQYRTSQTCTSFSAAQPSYLSFCWLKFYHLIMDSF